MATTNLSNFAIPKVTDLANQLLANYGQHKNDQPIIADRATMTPETQALLAQIQSQGSGVDSTGIIQNAVTNSQGQQTQAQDLLQQAAQRGQSTYNDYGIQQGIANTAVSRANNVLTQAIPGMTNDINAGVQGLGEAQNSLSQAINPLANIAGGGQNVGIQQVAQGAYDLQNAQLMTDNINAINRQASTDVNNLQDTVNRNLQENELPSIYRHATGTGNVGSSRSAIAEGIAQRGASEAIAKGVTNIENTANLKAAELRNQAYQNGLKQSQSILEGNRASQIAGGQALTQAGSAQAGIGKARGDFAKTRAIPIEVAGELAKIAGGNAATQAQAGAELSKLSATLGESQADLAKLTAETGLKSAGQLQEMSMGELTARLQAASALQNDDQAAKIQAAMKAKAAQNPQQAQILSTLQSMLAVNGQGYVNPEGGSNGVNPLEQIAYSFAGSVAGGAAKPVGQAVGNWLTGLFD